MTDIITYIQAVYWALRSSRKINFNEDDYFWKIGVRFLKDLEMTYPLENTVTMLYGIKVEIDYINPENIRLYEDITYKIGEVENE